MKSRMALMQATRWQQHFVESWFRQFGIVMHADCNLWKDRLEQWLSTATRLSVSALSASARSLIRLCITGHV
jgi:hypothetical protein